MGVPYQDFIPSIPMVQDPITGQWRNAQPGEIPGVEGGGEDQLPPVTQTPDSEPPVQPSPPGDPMDTHPLFEQDLFNPDAPGPTISKDLFDSTAPGETLDTGLISDLARNPQIAEKVNDDPDMAAALARDPGMIDQLKQDAPLSEEEPSSVTEPAGVTDQGFTHPSHTEQLSPEPSMPEQDHLDDHVSM